LLVDLPIKGGTCEQHICEGDLCEITPERTGVELLEVDLPALGGKVELVDVPKLMAQDQRVDGRES